MTARTLSSQLASLGTDETLSEYTSSLFGNPFNLESITKYQNSVNKYKSGRRSQIQPVIPPKLIFDPELQLFSLYMQSIQLNPALTATISQPSTVFQDCIHENQFYANEQSIWQFAKQQAVRYFEISDPISVAVWVLDWESIDSKRIFDQVIYIYSSWS